MTLGAGRDGPGEPDDGVGGDAGADGGAVVIAIERSTAPGDRSDPAGVWSATPSPVGTGGSGGGRERGGRVRGGAGRGSTAARRARARRAAVRDRSIDRREEREARKDGRTDASERRGDAGGTASRSRRRAVDVAKDASTRRDERRNRSGDDRAAGRRAATRAARRPRASRRRRRTASKILRDERIERISSRRASLAAPGGHRATFAAHLGASVRAARTTVRGARVA